MKNTLVMALFSRRSLTESVARQQITALGNFGDGLMCPDKWGKTEPIRTQFDPANISAPIRWLVEPHGEFFYRKGSPVQVSGEIWNLTHPSTARFPSPLFSNYWTGRFDGKWAARIGIEKVQEFVSEMFRVTGSDFGFLTTEDDLKAKNSDATAYSYQGLKLETGIPGLYWTNFFSNEFAEWLGVKALPNEIVSLKAIAGGISIKFCEYSEQCRDATTFQKQSAAIERLGKGRFFDIRFPDRQLETPTWAEIS
jgi:hypothetical protein